MNAVRQRHVFEMGHTTATAIACEILIRGVSARVRSGWRPKIDRFVPTQLEGVIGYTLGDDGRVGVPQRVAEQLIRIGVSCGGPCSEGRLRGMGGWLFFSFSPLVRERVTSGLRIGH